MNHLKTILKNSTSTLVFLFILVEGGQQYYQYLSMMAQENQTMQIFVAIGQLLISLIEFIILAMLIPQRLMELDAHEPPQSFLAFSKKHIGSLTSEGIRSFAVSLLWLIVFIIPGILKYIRFFFVPYVVVADPQYQTGNRDALEYSNQLVKGKTLSVLLIIVALTALDTVRSMAREHFEFTASPLPALVIAIFFFFVTIYSNILLFRYYQNRVKTIEEQAKPHS
ncbi:MAG: hypothetical protein ABL927_07055 [Bdellovibrionales bacterium]